MQVLVHAYIDVSPPNANRITTLRRPIRGGILAPGPSSSSSRAATTWAQVMTIPCPCTRNQYKHENASRCLRECALVPMCTPVPLLDCTTCTTASKVFSHVGSHLATRHPCAASHHPARLRLSGRVAWRFANIDRGFLEKLFK